MSASTMTTANGRLADRVYGDVKAQLLNGVYPPGQFIPIEEVAAQSKVSRQPVMDAMRRLEAEGLVTIVPQVGTQAREYEPGEIADYYRLFAGMEAIMAEFAAERATPEDILEMRMISAQIGKTIVSTSDDSERDRQYRVLNRRLHEALRRASRSEVVSTVVARMSDRVYYFAAGTGKPLFGQRLLEQHREHEELIDAIESRDAARARQILLAHTMALGSAIAQSSQSQ